MSGGDCRSKITVSHGLEWFQNLMEDFPVFLIFVADLDIIPSVTVYCLILLRLFNSSFNRVGRDGINIISVSANYPLTIVDRRPRGPLWCIGYYLPNQ